MSFPIILWYKFRLWFGGLFHKGMNTPYDWAMLGAVSYWQKPHWEREWPDRFPEASNSTLTAWRALTGED